MFRDLAVTIDFDQHVDEMLCGCGTNCSVCTGTGTLACNQLGLDSDTVSKLEEMLDSN